MHVDVVDSFPPKQRDKTPQKNSPEKIRVVLFISANDMSHAGHQTESNSPTTAHLNSII